ncbi:MAG: hypothetical protein Q4A79_02010 [Candidatus Saccharibacteria bacterium]|nr:hypothetical protein [Candidatus Saccharibacteria bacterium]
MTRNVSIVPAILTDNPADYRSQIEKINVFARRVQIDLTDGVFAPTRTLDITQIMWPKGWTVDLHLMVANPSAYMGAVVKLAPSLCILHAEAREDLRPIFQLLKSHGIRAGVALLQTTYPGDIAQYIKLADHVLIFAGQLGAQGGQADLIQVEKVSLIRNIKPEVEIGWDGGVNLFNVRMLAHSGIDVINVGSAISASDNPAGMFEQLVAETTKDGVII